jgi:hypothetical protein
MKHVCDRLWERYGFFVAPTDLLRVIRAGNAKELLSKGEGNSARQFDVPLVFEDGTKATVRCLVGLSLENVITILPPERRMEIIKRKEGEHARKVHKQMRQGPQSSAEEAVASVELDEDAREKLEQERAQARATTSLGNMTVLERMWYENAKKRLEAYEEL